MAFLRLPRLARVPVLLALLASACAHAPPRAADPPPAPWFAGTWSGTGVQSDQPGEWSILLTLTPTPTGAIRGTIVYPSLACGGVLVHESDRVSGQLVMKERIEFGDCLRGGTVVLARRTDGGIAYHWYSTPAGVTAGGMLYPVTR